MNIIRFVSMLAVGLGCWSTAGAVEPQTATPVRLSRNMNTPVILLEFEEAASTSDGSENQSLAIYADGRAVVSVPGADRRQVTGRVPSRELQTLLNDLFVKHDLLDCRTVSLQRSIRTARRERQRPEPGDDAATTVIQVQTETGTHEVRCHALGLTASQLPDLAAVRNLFACQQRLENVASIIRAGGYDQVRTVLTTANRQLKRQSPTAETLTSRDLSLVDLRPDGTRYLQFSRVPDVDGLRPAGGLVMVSVYQAPGRPPEITVTADPS